MVEELDDVSVYEGSDGRYYTDWQVDRKLRTGAWKPGLREVSSGRRLIETAEHELLLLVPTDSAELPEWVRIRLDRAGPRVVDTRRAVPPASSNAAAPPGSLSPGGGRRDGGPR